MFETIDTCATHDESLQDDASERRPVASFVRFVYDGLHFLHRHLILIDQLNHVDPASASVRTFARASSTPFTPQRT